VPRSVGSTAEEQEKLERIAMRSGALKEVTMSTPFDSVARWWRNWKVARANVERLDCCGAAEMERMAHDVGVSTPELRALAGKWPDAAEPLNRRLAALALDPADIRRVEPQVLHDLQRVCTMCAQTRECGHDLAEHPSDPGWRDYCPNVMTLDALAEERTQAKKAN
jgi:hypothetical protein